MLLDATRHACNLHLDQALIVLFHEEHAPICPWFTVGIVGPLTPLPVFSVRSIGRSVAAGRRGAGALGRSIRAPDWTAAGSLQPLLLLRLTPFPSLSLPPSAPQRSCANPTIGTVARGRNRFQLRGRTDADGRSDGRRERLVHWSSEQASQVFTASAVDQSSFSPSPSLSP